VPKLMRVLGTDQLGPPDVVVPTLPPEPTVHEAVGHAMARSLDQLLFHDPRIRLGGDEEDLHQFRVAVRRLRSDLRTFVDVLDVLDGPSAAALARELGWLADATSAAVIWMCCVPGWSQLRTRFRRWTPRRWKNWWTVVTSKRSRPAPWFSRRWRAGDTSICSTRW
jgi:hypothetical protein